MRTISLAVPCAALLLLASCIAAERENSECDLEAIWLHIENPSEFFFNDNDTLKVVGTSDSSIVFTIRSNVNIQSVPTTLRITDGATAYLVADDGQETPFLNGSLVDFSEEQIRQFRVRSQDRIWSRDYSIYIEHDKPIEIPDEGAITMDFEDYYLDASGKYYVWSAPDFFTDGEWKNGNPGFKISRSSATPMEYPSTPAIGGGHNGSACLKLETCDTGAFGKMANMRIASGSMFNGVFDVTNALKNALKATQFGTPFPKKPTKMHVWLRYEPGSTFQERNGNAVSGVIDEPDAYVVLYRNEDASGNPIVLDGNDVLSSPYIVGLGRLPHHYNSDGSDQLSANPIHGVTDQWQEFIIPVEYRSEVNAQELENKGYSLIIGFASSWQGAYFKGAIGSKYYIDDIKLFCE